MVNNVRLSSTVSMPQFNAIVERVRAEYAAEWGFYDGRAIEAALDNGSTEFFHRVTCYINNKVARNAVRIERFVNGLSEEEIVKLWGHRISNDAPCKQVAQ